MKKRHFSLLEVLIAIMLITASLPLLLTPFVYASVDQMETIQKLKQEQAAQYIITTLLGDLQTGTIPLNQLDQGSDYPFRSEWNTKEDKYLGSYKFNKLKGDNEEGVELWQVSLSLEDPAKKTVAKTVFSYEFIVKRIKEASVEPPQE